MRSALVVFTVLVSLGGTRPGVAAPSPGCYMPGATAELNPSNPRVVQGGDIFHRDQAQYPFSTFSAAERDPTSADRVCFHYEVENNTMPHQEIKSFRWKDIKMPFTDVAYPTRVRWDQN